MKITFSDTVPYVPSWRGNDKLPDKEQIKCELKVLDMGSLLNLVDAFSKAGIQGEVDTNADAAALRPVLEQFGSLVPQHVVSFKGLFDDAGKAITIEQVIEYPVFLNLSLELLMKLAEISSPSEEDIKN